MIRQRDGTTQQMRHSKPATMVQIAERAGVALSTVSYVLSGKRPVSQEMRERVQTAIEELDYRPHRPARALASGTSHTIALFLPWSQWQLLPLQQTFVAGAAQATSASDYGLLLSTATTDPETITQLVARGRADGVILMETLLDDPRVERLLTEDIRSCSSDAPATRRESATLIWTSQMPSRRAWHTWRGSATPVSPFSTSPPDQLSAGYTSALLAREIFEQRAPDFGIRGIHIACSPEPSEAFATAAQLLRSEPACTAAITTSWQFPGVLSALRAADLRVPDDFSIVSILASQFAEMLAPSLTGIEWPAFEAGRMAAEMLIEQLTGQDVPARQHLISATLVVRESTGPAPRGRAAIRPHQDRLTRSAG